MSESTLHFKFCFSEKFATFHNDFFVEKKSENALQKHANS